MGSESAPEQPRLYGAYVLLKALGRGAMGDVHLARPVDPNRGVPTPVVVKRLHVELSGREGFVARFRHEAAIAVSVDSPHVAKVYDVGSVGDSLYMVMEHVAGWPLSSVLEAILESGRHASIASVVDLIAGGLEGLQALHTARDPQTGRALGIVHRDLSPKNLMVGEDGIMRLIDLGLGKSNVQDWRTRTGVVMGSVGYMPPEQARGERVDARSDVYAMGVVAFEMLALRNYIKRGTLGQMMAASAVPTFVRPSEFRPDVPRGLDLVIQRALQSDKEQRFSSAKSFLDELRTVVPRSYTEGGMAGLLQDLFGEARKAREQEQRVLLALPTPEDDPFESGPTKVFVMRDGVLPPDVQPTKPVRSYDVSRPREPVPESERTAATEVAWQTGGHRAADPRAPRAGSVSPMVGPIHGHAGLSPTDGVAPIVTTHQFAAPRGVPIPVLMVAVLVAAVLGGLVAVGAVSYLNSRAVVPIQLPAQPPPQTQAKLTSKPVVEELPSSTRNAPEEVEPAPEPDPVRPKTVRTAPPPRTEVAPARAPLEVSNAALDAELDRLKDAAVRLKTAAVSDRRQELIKVIVDIGMWQKSQDVEKKKQAVRSLRARLNEIGDPS